MPRFFMHLVDGWDVLLDPDGVMSTRWSCQSLSELPAIALLAMGQPLQTSASKRRMFEWQLRTQRRAARGPTWANPHGPHSHARAGKTRNQFEGGSGGGPPGQASKSLIHPSISLTMAGRQ